MSAVRWVLAAALAALSAVALGAGGSALAAPAERDGIGELGTCVAEIGSLDAVFLIDESASLQKTDSANRRVDALKVALASLSTLESEARDAGISVEVDVLLAGFSVEYEALTGWIRLDETSASGLDPVVRQYASRNRGIDTDYAAALIGAQAELAREAASDIDGETCGAVFFFTDGQYDIEPRSTGETKSYARDLPIRDEGSAAALEARGKQLLCDRNGTLDALRRDGVAVVTIALSAAESAILPEDQAFLQGLATGRGARNSCGTVPVGTASAVGSFLTADEVSDLLFRFFGAVQGIVGGTEVTDDRAVEVCPSRSCAAGRRKFVIDPGIRSFNLLAITGAPGITLELESPDSTEPVRIRPLEPTDASIGAGRAVASWAADDAALIDVELPGDEGPWNGEWSVTFIDETGANPDAMASWDVYLFGDLVPTFSPAPDLRAGEAGTITVRLERRSDTPVDTGLFAVTELDVAVTDPATGDRETVAMQPAGDGATQAGTWTAPSPEFPAVVNVSATLRVRTRSGIELRPITRSTAARVAPPSSYPHVEPEELAFPALTGTGTSTARLDVVGGETAGGCVWIDGAAVTGAPQPAGDVTLEIGSGTSRDDCIRVEPGQRKQIELSATPYAAADGVVSGTVRVKLISDSNKTVLTSTVPLRLRLSRPVDASKRWVVFIALLLGGLGVAVAMMWALNWAVGTLKLPVQVRRASVPVGIDAEDKLTRLDARPGPLLIPSDFDSAVERESARWFETDEVKVRSRSLRAFPWLPARGEAIPKSDQELISSGYAERSRDGLRAPMPLGVVTTWLLLIPSSSDADGPIVGRLVAFVDMERRPEQTDILNRDIAATCATSVNALRECARQRQPASAEADSGPDVADLRPPSSVHGSGFPLGPTPPPSSVD